MKLRSTLLLLAAAALVAGCDKAAPTPAANPSAPNQAPSGARPAGDQNVFKVPVGDSAARGPADALVTIVEFSDYECPFCSRAHATVKQLEKDYEGKIRVVMKQNPLPFHARAKPAAAAVLAAGEQDKFWEMHDKLFENQKALQDADLEKYATEIGLDMGKFKASIADAKWNAVYDRDQQLGRKMGATGTPAFFINGRFLSGAQPIDNFKKIIDEELVKAKALVDSGVPASQVYAKTIEKGLEAAPAKPAPQAQGGGSTVKKIDIPAGAPAKGPATAKVTVVEWSDFECPFCSRGANVVKQVVETYGQDVRVVFRHQPLPFHPRAKPAAAAAMAAHEQGKFWEMHDKLFADRTKLSDADFEKYAEEIGLNVGKFKEALSSGKFNAVVESDSQAGTAVGANGTPTFFINGRQLVGAQPFDNFKKMIDEEIKKADDLLKAGTPATELYAKLNAKNVAEAPAAPAQQAPRPPAGPEVKKVEIPASAPSLGNKAAKVTMVAWSDFQCPFCSRVVPTMKKLEETYGKDLRVVFRHQPLSFHNRAKPAAVASMAAHQQGKFWEMHDKLFENQRALEDADLEKYAAELKLDMKKFKAGLADKKLADLVDQDAKDGMAVGANGTPAFFINGRKVSGAQPFESFKAIIDDELKKADALLKSGVKPDQLYAKLNDQNVADAGKAAPAAGAAAPEAPVDIQVGSAPAKGDKKAPVTIVLYSDFQCPFCSRVGPTLKQIEEAYGNKVRIAFKHQPLPFHNNARIAAYASMAAHEQGKFWEMHDKLFANQQKLDRQSLDAYAQELKLDMNKFADAMNKEKFKAAVDADQAEAGKVGANGTPTLFVNGRKIVGAQPFDNFKKLIDEELAKATAKKK
jgi:protein-disulfide isomerase